MPLLKVPASWNAIRRRFPAAVGVITARSAARAAAVGSTCARAMLACGVEILKGASHAAPHVLCRRRRLRTANPAKTLKPHKAKQGIIARAAGRHLDRGRLAMHCMAAGMLTSVPRAPWQLGLGAWQLSSPGDGDVTAGQARKSRHMAAVYVHAVGRLEAHWSHRSSSHTGRSLHCQSCSPCWMFTYTRVALHVTAFRDAYCGSQLAYQVKLL